MIKKKEKVHNWIWENVDLSKMPVVRLTKPKKNRYERISLNNKPADWFFGDWDKDGVRNPFDCQPRNPKKQGATHEAEMGVPFEYIEQMANEGKTVGDLKEFIRRKREKLNKKDED